MDNITHTLIGLAVGHGINAFRKLDTTPQNADRRTTTGAVTLVASVLGNNAPDGDIIFSPLLGDGRLGSLLHHRGFTHTLLAAPVLGAAVAILTFLLFRRKPISMREGLFTWFVGALGIILHVTADGWNDYGVHPFVPFDNHWRYGDSIFIIEPLLWLSLLWTLKFSSAVWLTVVRRGLAVLSLGLLLFFPGVSWITGAMGFVWAAMLYTYQRYVSLPLLRLIPPLLVLSVFATTSRMAKATLVAQVAGQIPVQAQDSAPTPAPADVAATFFEVLTSPSPSNPWCWRAMVSLKTNNTVETHLGFVSLWPALFTAESCHVRKPKATTYRLMPPKLLASPRVHWFAHASLDLNELQKLVDLDCVAKRVLTFTRFPFIERLSSGAVIVGDHRYDFDESLGFSEYEIQTDGSRAGDGCLHLPTPWRTRVTDTLL